MLRFRQLDLTHLGHVANHPPGDLVARVRRGLPQNRDVAPGDLEGSHDAFQQGGFPTTTRSQETITVFGTMENTRH